MTQTRLKIDSFVFEGLYIKALAIPENENTLSTDFKSVDVHTLACWLPRYSHYEGSDYGFFLERTEKDIRDLLQQMII